MNFIKHLRKNRNQYFQITEKTPSLNEIKNLKNTELDEIFGATMSKTPPPDLPDMGPIGSSGPDPIGRFNRVPPGPRELPINHGHALSPQPNPGQSGGEFQSLAAQGANVFATGATAFYRSVGIRTLFSERIVLQRCCNSWRSIRHSNWQLPSSAF